MSKQTHIFFDLDHTLWDFESNSKATLIQLFEELKLEQLGILDAQTFVYTYLQVNDYYWQLYRQKMVSKATLREGRFISTFEKLGIPAHEMPRDLPDLYVSICPHKTMLMPNAMEILEYLNGKYPLHIITNGFKESQLTKLQSSGIGHFFDHLVFSEEVKCHKPDKAIFDEALRLSNADRSTSYFIGDHLEADVLGSKNAGLIPVYFNPDSKLHQENLPHEIVDLLELKKIL